MASTLGVRLTQGTQAKAGGCWDRGWPGVTGRGEGEAGQQEADSQWLGQALLTEAQ